MLPVYIIVCLKSVFTYKFLILDTHYPDTIYVNKDVRISGYFSKQKGDREQRILGDTAEAEAPST
jgi:hypothetical protein